MISELGSGSPVGSPLGVIPLQGSPTLNWHSKPMNRVNVKLNVLMPLCIEKGIEEVFTHK